MSSVTTWSAIAGSTRLPSSSAPSSVTVRSRRFSDRQASERARSTGSVSLAVSIRSGRRLGGLDRHRRHGAVHAALARGRVLACARRRSRLGVALDGRHEVLADAERLVDLALDLLGDLGVLVEELLGVVAPLAQPL